MVKTILRRVTRRFRRDQSGATAVEFGMVALPFFLLTTAILESALFFFTQTMIEDGLLAAARDIRTGAFQNDGRGEDEFRAEICGHVNLVANCGLLEVEVRRFSSFASADFSIPRDADGNLDPDGLSFDDTDPSDVVLVRVFYPYQLYFPGFFAGGLANLPGNKRLVAAATAFRIEPFVET